ncbi:ACT domain-containing protein [Fodinisporobacter ferrooxydans]|uniref:ACT domain-containing protein n=1 Tax=Fodinisporobacter ferrooxydans TaxID=2901836 RepID=A0ABY4CNU7_9BACL|nr:ACT domain-containing protein [Alicyclobacillaceae bacterium MYW30-H2]
MLNLDTILALIRHFFVSNVTNVNILVCEDQVDAPEQLLNYLQQVYADVQANGRITVSHKDGEAIALQMTSDEGVHQFQISRQDEKFYLSKIDAFAMKVTGESPALFIYHQDKVGVIAAVTAKLSERDINIARLDVHRRGKGQDALLVMELDVPIDPAGRQELTHLQNVTHVDYYLPPRDLQQLPGSIS